MADRNFSTKVIVTESGSTDAIVANAVDGDGLKGIVTGIGAAVHGVVPSSGGNGANAGIFEQNNTSNASFALFIQQLGNSPAINAVNQNSGTSASAIKGSANNSDAVLGNITGSGTAIHGVVNNGYTGAAGNFEQNSTSSSSNAVSISNAGSGKALSIANSTTSVSNALEANNSNSANTGIAVKGISNASGGIGLYGSNLSTGYAGYFDNKVSFQGNLETVDGKGLLFPNSSTGFPTGTAGQLYYHPTFKALFIYDGSAWIQHTIPNVTSFPSSPSTNLRVYRSDRGLEYYYDGTRWLTAEVFNVQMLSRSIMPFAQAAVISLDANIAAIAEYSGTLIEKVNWSIYQSTTATASVNISLAFYAFTSTGAGTSNLFTTSPTNNGAVANTWTSFSNVPTLLVPTALNNTYTKLEVALTSNGATGNWYAAISVKCRGIG